MEGGKVLVIRNYSEDNSLINDATVNSCVLIGIARLNSDPTGWVIDIDSFSLFDENRVGY